MDALIHYAARGTARPYYFANDHARDHVPLDKQMMALTNGRQANPALDREGFVLVPHQSAVADFEGADVGLIHPDEIIALVKAQTGADLVLVTAPGILRFSERSGRAGTLDNSMPARFAHIDVTPETAQGFAEQTRPPESDVRRFAQYNIWRAFSGAPQDVPLAVCDARSLAPDDRIEADAIFDQAGKPDWSFASWVIAHNPAHRWHWFPDMTPDEALIFKTCDSDPAHACAVPHVAFDNPDCPDDAPPRASIEMRATAFWFA
jgi:hypothetical protein